MKKFRSIPRQIRRGNLKVETYDKMILQESGSVEKVPQTTLLRKAKNGKWVNY